MITTRKRNPFNRLAVILLVLLSIALILTIIMAFNLKFEKNKISDLKQTIKTTAMEKETLTSTVSQQAAQLNDLATNLSFFITPEEGRQSDEAVISSDAAAAAISQDTTYPTLFAASKNSLASSNQKIAYLTFDDGPSNLTPAVLDILDQYNAKATFFVIGTTNEEYQQYYQAIIDRGHTLAMHSYSHNYTTIYSSVNSFLDDYQQLFDLIYSKTGQIPTLMRYPGGSINSYNGTIRDSLITEMQNRGFIYYDWNVSCGDGTSTATTESIYQKVIDECASYQKPVILMHDGQGHQATIDALPGILQTLTEQGYVFNALTSDMTPTQFPR